MNLILKHTPSNNIIEINPKGHIVICSLWTPPINIFNKLNDDFKTSIALIGNLYGGGLKIMLRNLIYNPQIEYIIIHGKDLSGNKEHLVNFFNNNIEYLNKKKKYISELDNKEKELELVSILGSKSNYITDNLILSSMFINIPKIIDTDFNDTLLEWAIINNSNKRKNETKRIYIELPKYNNDTFPNEIHSHQIVDNGILDCWEKLLFKLKRFGQEVSFRDGKKRLELLNIKTVILNPGPEKEERLNKFNISNETILEYQDNIINPELNGNDYTYGNRIRKYFNNMDLLDIIANDIKNNNLDSRHNYISLWDNTKDLTNSHSPCLVSIFFRYYNNKLDLTATFRSHNGSRAFPINCFGLYNIMKYICDKSNIEIGVLTIISNSMTLDILDLDNINLDNKKYKLKLDDNGYFNINIDSNYIIIKHYSHNGELLKEYKDNNSINLCKQLYMDEAISDISHALYIGRQLEKAEYCLLNNIKYIQEN